MHDLYQRNADISNVSFVQTLWRGFMQTKSFLVLALFIACSACSAVESTGDAVSATGRGAGDALSGASDAVGDAGQAVAEGAGDIIEGTGDAVSSGSRRTASRGY
jgi:hypothetical protein